MQICQMYASDTTEMPEALSSEDFFGNLNLNAEVLSTQDVFENSSPTLSTSQSAKKLLKAVTDDAEDDYNDYDEDKNSSHSRQRNPNITERIGITYAWGRWEKWSKCSKSCVQIKRRNCIERIKTDDASTPATNTTFFPDMDTDAGKVGCHGMMKKYRLCKDDKCRSSRKQLRDEQCAQFNKIAYKGKFYNWRGYEKEHQECQLYCRPHESEILVSLNQSVTDGVPCQKPAVYYTHVYRRQAVCVEGICRAVHTSGAIRPATTNDSQLKCGSVLCQAVSKLYSFAKPPYGNQLIATIPAGAMNLTIKQMARSDNLLVLKSTDGNFIINGNIRVSDSGTFEYNDDVYDYNREVSVITSKGPLSKPVVLMLFVRGLNTGVKYDYTLPVPSANVDEDEELLTQWNELGQPLHEIDNNNIEGTLSAQLARAKDRKRRKFSWKLLGFGQCNRSCGPGVQPPIFRCIRDSPTRYYSPKRCAFADKPTFSEDIYHCNHGLCPAHWRPGDYGECQCSDSGTGVEGVRTRYVQCVQEQITGKVDEVAESLCAEEKLPELTVTCNCPKQNRRKIYARGPDKASKVYSRLRGSPTIVRSVYNHSMPFRRHIRDDRTDKAGVWLMSDWNPECSADCGIGFEHRSIYCDRTPPYTDLCDLRYTPEQKRSCGVGKSECLAGTWFASEWSNCTGDCFSLQRRRTVLCLSDGIVVNDEVCDAVGKPRDVSNCTHKEVNFCGSKWHYSEWSECSRTCGEGIQRRYAKCLEYDWKQNAMVESNQCKYLEREPVYGACTAQNCEELNRNALSLDVVQNNTTVAKSSFPVAAAADVEDCSDDFSNCKRINRQRLCKLQYYKTYCCLTCNGYY